GLLSSTSLPCPRRIKSTAWNHKRFISFNFFVDRHLDRIAEHVSTHVAHAGNKESRLNKLLDNFNIRDAMNTLRQLKEVADLTGVWFANEGGAGLATFLGDQFEGLDQPIVTSAEIEKLEAQWQEIDRDIAKWSISTEVL
ncbi:hypothetical protein VQ045_15935, partial [Aurantimonas sp. E1-2-R+4]